MSQRESNDVEAGRLKALRAVELHFSPYVFAGPTFPDPRARR